MVRPCFKACLGFALCSPSTQTWSANRGRCAILAATWSHSAVHDDSCMSKCCLNEVGSTRMTLPSYCSVFFERDAPWQGHWIPPRRPTCFQHAYKKFWWFTRSNGRDLILSQIASCSRRSVLPVNTSTTTNAGAARLATRTFANLSGLRIATLRPSHVFHNHVFKRLHPQFRSRVRQDLSRRARPASVYVVDV